MHENSRHRVYFSISFLHQHSAKHSPFYSVKPSLNFEESRIAETQTQKYPLEWNFADSFLYCLTLKSNKRNGKNIAPNSSTFNLVVFFPSNSQFDKIKM